MQVRAWLPKRQLIVTADSSYAALELLAASPGLSAPVTIVTRLRLDAALYDPAPPRQPGQRGAPRKKGHASQTWLHAWTTRRLSGLSIPSPGTAARYARFVWPPALRSGTTAGCRQWHCAGC